MHTVFRIREWGIEGDSEELRLNLTCSCRPTSSTLPKLIEASFPGATAELRRTALVKLLAFGRDEDRVKILGRVPPQEAVEGLLSLLCNILTICDDADVSHCLDLYRLPAEDVEPDA